MPLWLSGGKTILFMHIPKTGGSALQSYLERRLGKPLFAFTGKVKAGGTGLIHEPVHFTAEDIGCCVDIDTIDYAFAIVREPVQRLMSEYRYQTNISRASRMSFSTWAHLMIETARREPRIYNNHLRPQVDFIPERADAFRLEEGFDPLIEKLDAVLGAPGPKQRVPIINVSPKIPISVSQQVVDLVANFYAEDYEKFSYPRPVNEPGGARSLSRMAAAKALAPALVAWQRHSWTR